MKTNIIPKQQDHAFGKDIYLLGTDKHGIKHWLEAPSWDCGWYWGFGYIETYTNNDNPSASYDIEPHSHAGNFMRYCTDSNRILTSTTFNEKEAWKLCELFSRFKLFKQIADYYYKGGCNISVLGDGKKDEAKCKHINEVEIPYVTAEILKILRG